MAQVEVKLPPCFSCSSLSSQHGSDEGTQGSDEGWRCDDANRRVPVGGRDHRVEDEGREGRRGCIHGCGRGAGEEVRLLQVRGYAEHEVEEQASNEGTQGYQPLHQGAVRLQGEACLEDSEVLRDEEAQGDALKEQGVRVLSLLKVGNGLELCLADSSCGGRPHRALLYT